MKKQIPKVLLLTSLLQVLTIGSLISQDYSKHSLKVGLGLGASMGNNTEGYGFLYSIGYQRVIWNKRFRFNPNFSIGHYSSKFINDARDQYFTSINVGSNLYYDLVKLKTLSLVIGGGGLVNCSSGLKGTGGDPDAYTGQSYSEYVNDLHIAGYLGTGLRINPGKRRTAINIMPINIHFGNNYFSEVLMKIEFDIKF